jgi:hypothetical protein
LPCGNITIRIDESSDYGIIVSALQVIEPRLIVIVVATVAEGVDEGDMGGVGNGVTVSVNHGEKLSEGGIGIVANYGSRPVGIDFRQSNDVPLEILHYPVDVGVVVN